MIRGFVLVRCGIHARTRAVNTTVVFSLLALHALLAPSQIARAQSTSSDASTTPVAHFRLVRCGPRRAAACLATRAIVTAATPPDARWVGRLMNIGMVGPEYLTPSGASPGGIVPVEVAPVFAAPVLPTSSLGRTTLRGSLTLMSRDRVAARALATWRPPLLTLPAFTGTATANALPAAVREAMAVGIEPAGIRLPLVLLMALTGLLLATFVPRFAWVDHRQNEEDLARQLAAARALLSTQELEQLRGKAPKEARPRKPEEPTQETAILPRSR